MAAPYRCCQSGSSLLSCFSDRCIVLRGILRTGSHVLARHAHEVGMTGTEALATLALVEVIDKIVVELIQSLTGGATKVRMNRFVHIELVQSPPQWHVNEQPLVVAPPELGMIREEAREHEEEAVLDVRRLLVMLKVSQTPSAIDQIEEQTHVISHHPDTYVVHDAVEMRTDHVLVVRQTVDLVHMQGAHELAEAECPDKLAALVLRPRHLVVQCEFGVVAELVQHANARARLTTVEHDLVRGNTATLGVHRDEHFALPRVISIKVDGHAEIDRWFIRVVSHVHLCRGYALQAVDDVRRVLQIVHAVAQLVLVAAHAKIQVLEWLTGFERLEDAHERRWLLSFALVIIYLKRIEALRVNHAAQDCPTTIGPCLTDVGIEDADWDMFGHGTLRL